MPASATVNISGTVTGLTTGSKTLAATLSSAAAVGQTLDIVLASGDNTIAVPTGATAVLIQPPAANAIALKIKGVGGDTGVLLSKTNPSLIALDPAVTSFLINAASLTTGSTEFSFF